MGPKAKPKTPKGKGKGGKAEQENQEEPVTELDKEFYLFQLAQIDKKIERLKASEEKLKAETAEIEDKIEEFKKEKGTVVTMHEEILAGKEEEKNKIKNETIQLSEEIKVRIENHQKAIEDLEVQYKNMLKELTTSLEDLEEEIRILEDYKNRKCKFTNKLEELENEIEEGEREHHRNLFKIEKKWENARGRVNKELQSRLLQLSIEFRQTSQKKIGKPCHRVTQENKAIHSALIAMKEEICQYNENEKRATETIKELKYRMKKKQDENDRILAKTIYQLKIIQSLTKEQSGLAEELKNYLHLDATNRGLWRRMQYMNSELQKKAASIERLKQDIHNKTESMNAMKESKKYLKKATRKLQMIIRSALKVLEDGTAVRLIPVGEIAEERQMTMEGKVRAFRMRRQSVFERKGRILQSAYDLLSKAQLTEEDRKLLRSSSESVTLVQVKESIAHGRSIYSMEKENEEKETSAVTPELTYENPFLIISNTSLPRSESSFVIIPVKRESEESFEGEYEEYGMRGEHAEEEEEGEDRPEGVMRYRARHSESSSSAESEGETDEEAYGEQATARDRTSTKVTFNDRVDSVEF